MPEPLDEQYLKWLYARIGSVRVSDPGRTYWFLLRKLYTTEYVWLIPNDDNRVEDGRDLRLEFLESRNCREQETELWLGLGCSVLEFLLGVANKLSFEVDGDTRVWFWKLLDNLDLGDQSDAMHSEAHIDEVIHKLVWRTYDANGSGGLFPLQYPDRDQRKVEVWYQLCAYLLEREEV